MTAPVPVHLSDTVTIYHGDCLEILPTLEGVDAVVTDPPYAIPAAHYVGKRGEKAPQRSLGELSIVEAWFRQVSDYFPANGPIYVFCDGQSYPIFYRSCYNRWKRIRPLIWDKVTSYNGYTWRHQHELIAWGESINDERVPTGDGDIISCRAVPVDDRLHPAEKPAELIKRLLSKLPLGCTVLDPFMGSGTTGIACIRTDRRFIGIEIDEHYFNVARQRLENELAQGRLEL